ncbi:hypothetical protein ACFPRL_02300 [Pseudoclavibacter helvolus]
MIGEQVELGGLPILLGVDDGAVHVPQDGGGKFRRSHGATVYGAAGRPPTPGAYPWTTLHPWRGAR